MTHTLSNESSASIAIEPAATMSAPNAESTLRLVLRANALTSALGGVAMATASTAIDELLGTGHPGWVRVVGLALLPFAAFVAWLTTADRRQLSLHTPGIIVGDAGWVAASTATILLGWYSASGVIAVSVMAAAVGTFGTLQYVLLRRLSR